jgi:hypothetical protein
MSIADKALGEDAALLDAWTSYRLGHDILIESCQESELSKTELQAREDRLGDFIELYRAFFSITPAKTLTGLVVRLSFLCCDAAPPIAVHDTIFKGQLLPDDAEFGPQDRLMFDILKNVRALADAAKDIAVA